MKNLNLLIQKIYLPLPYIVFSADEIQNPDQKTNLFNLVYKDYLMYAKLILNLALKTSTVITKVASHFMHFLNVFFSYSKT